MTPVELPLPPCPSCGARWRPDNNVDEYDEVVAIDGLDRHLILTHQPTCPRLTWLASGEPNKEHIMAKAARATPSDALRAALICLVVAAVVVALIGAWSSYTG